MKVIRDTELVTKKTEKHELEKAYLAIARDENFWRLDQEEFLQTLCVSVCKQLQVERVSVHLFGIQNTTLEPVILYSALSNTFSKGDTLSRNDYPAYFEALENFRIIDAENAETDGRTFEFASGYLKKYNIASLLDAGLYHAGKLQGVICTEDTGCIRKWNEAECVYLMSISDLLSQRLLHDQLKDETRRHGKLKAVEEAMLVSANYAIFTTDSEGQVLQVNKSTNDLLACSPEELLGTNFSKLLLLPKNENALVFFNREKIAEQQSISFNELITAIKQNNNADFECLVNFKESYFPTSLTVTPLKTKNGEIKGYICTIANITKRMNVRKNLTIQEQKYRHLFESSGDCIVLIKDGIVLDCNEEACKTFGCTTEQLLGQNVSRFSPELQPDGIKTEVRAKETTVLAMQGEKLLLEWQHLRYDGTPFHSEVTLSVVGYRDDLVLMASVRDVNERKKSEQALEKARNQNLLHNQELKLINELSNKLHATNSQDEIYQLTFDTLINYPIKPRVAIYSVNEDKNELHLKLHHGAKPGEISGVEIIPINPDFIGTALKTGELLYSPDIAKDDRILSAYRSVFAKSGLHSIVVIPLFYMQQNVAVVLLSYEYKNALTLNNLEVLYSIGKTVSLALINAGKNTELSYIAHHDELTGLTNRAFFHKSFGAGIEHNYFKKAALFLLDLDRFKEINDTLGHYTGDLLLQQISSRLSSIITKHRHQVSRLGGDEFIVWAGHVNTRAQAEKIAKSIVKVFSEPFYINELQLTIDASIGIAMFPEDGVDSHALLRSADVAMYVSKASEKTYTFYDSENDIHTPERLSLLADIGNSIKNANGELFLHYQPKVDLKTSEITGFEALARWEHPKLGMLSPGVFIPMIEMSNSIHDFTEEVLNQALAQQMQWRKEGSDYTVAVNISARNLMDDRLVSLIKELLVVYDADPSKLELEVTESAIMHDSFKAIDYLTQISNMGVKLSIDDFGTGYSSLAYLRNLPIHKLKLDRSFIMGMLNDEQGQSIVNTIVALAKNLKLEVIAEGVEDEHTLGILEKMECDTAQGYYICRPNTWVEVAHWINRRDKSSIEN